MLEGRGLDSHAVADHRWPNVDVLMCGLVYARKAVYILVNLKCLT